MYNNLQVNNIIKAFWAYNFLVYLIYLQVISTWIQSRYLEELKEVPSIQAEEAVLSVVAEDSSQVPVLKWEVVGNVPHRHVFRCYIIVTWILRKCF